MPAVAIAAAAFWATPVLGLAIGTWVTLGVTAYSIYSAQKQKKKARQAAKDAYNASLQDRLVMAATADGIRSRVYGEVRTVDGVIFKGTWGPHNKYYTLVVALAGHECESIEKVYFNDQELTLTSDGSGGFWVSTAPYSRGNRVSANATAMPDVSGFASVSLPHDPIGGTLRAFQGGDAPGDLVGWSVNLAATYSAGTASNTEAGLPDYAIVFTYEYLEQIPLARVWKYLGTAGQDIGSDLLASRFPDLINTSTNDDRFAGICLLAVELEYDQDAYPAGVPTVTALVRGAKCVDPRTDVAGWTQNPGVIARDWSLYQYGGACIESDLVDSAFIAAANACDISTEFTTPAGVETRPLYQCDFFCRLDVEPDKNVVEIVESMAGRWGWAGGLLTLVAGVYRSPVLTINEDWVSNGSDIGIVKDQPRSDVVNVYRPKIALADVETDPETSLTHAYSVVPIEEVRSEDYIAADGQELAREISLAGVTHNVHARHVAAVMLRDGRYSMTVSLPCKLHAWQLELFDVVSLNLPFFGFENQEFEVLGWRFNATSDLVLNLKEIDASIYVPDENFPLPNAQNNTSLVLPWIVPPVTGLTITSGIVDLEDGTPQTRVRLTWDEVTAANVLQSGKIEIQYWEVSPTLPPADWPSWIEEGGATSATIPNLRAGAYHFFKIRAVNTLRVRGPWSEAIPHKVATPPNDALEEALAAAAAAQAAADAALAEIDDVVSDSLLTPSEKVQVIIDYQAIVDEHDDINAKGAAQGIEFSTEQGTYQNDYEDLTNYFATLITPVPWDDLSGNTSIDPSTYTDVFTRLYKSRQEFLNLISVTIAENSVDTENIVVGAVSEASQIDYGEDSIELSGTAPSGETEFILSDQIEISVTDPRAYVRIDANATIFVQSITSSTDNATLTARLYDETNSVLIGSVYQDIKLVKRAPSREGPPTTYSGNLPIVINRQIGSFVGTRLYRLRLYWQLRDVNGDPSINLDSLDHSTKIFASGSIAYRTLKA